MSHNGSDRCEPREETMNRWSTSMIVGLIENLHFNVTSLNSDNTSIKFLDSCTCLHSWKYCIQQRKLLLRVSGNMVQTMVAHLSEERLPVGQFLLAKVKSASDEATERA